MEAIPNWPLQEGSARGCNEQAVLEAAENQLQNPLAHAITAFGSGDGCPGDYRPRSGETKSHQHNDDGPLKQGSHQTADEECGHDSERYVAGSSST
jgi:hypothetical protein